MITAPPVEDAVQKKEKLAYTHPHHCCAMSSSDQTTMTLLPSKKGGSGSSGSSKGPSSSSSGKKKKNGKKSATMTQKTPLLQPSSPESTPPPILEAAAAAAAVTPGEEEDASSPPWWETTLQMPETVFVELLDDMLGQLAAMPSAPNVVRKAAVVREILASRGIFATAATAATSGEQPPSSSPIERRKLVSRWAGKLSHVSPKTTAGTPTLARKMIVEGQVATWDALMAVPRGEVLRTRTAVDVEPIESLARRAAEEPAGSPSRRALEEKLYDPWYLMRQMDLPVVWQSLRASGDAASRDYLTAYLCHLTAMALLFRYGTVPLERVFADAKRKIATELPPDALETVGKLAEPHYTRIAGLFSPTPASFRMDTARESLQALVADGALAAAIDVFRRKLSPDILRVPAECSPHYAVAIVLLYGAGLQGGNFFAAAAQRNAGTIDPTGQYQSMFEQARAFFAPPDASSSSDAGGSGTGGMVDKLMEFARNLEDRSALHVSIIRAASTTAKTPVSAALAALLDKFNANEAVIQILVSQLGAFSAATATAPSSSQPPGSSAGTGGGGMMSMLMGAMSLATGGKR